MRIVAMLPLLFLFAMSAAAAGDRVSGNADAAISQGQLDDLVRRHPMFSGGVVIARDGEVVASAYAGFADREAGVRNNAETLHSVASVGKMFTAVAIAQLVEAHEFDYDTAVTSILPALEGQLGDDITVDHLLHHTSGIDRISGVDEATEDALAGNADYFALILEKDVRSSGPSGFTYRNENFQILGQIIEEVTGQAYEDYIREHIAEPAGMTGPIFVRQDRAGNPNIAAHYLAVDFDTWWNSEGPIVANGVDEFVHIAPTSTPSAGGGAYATALDMARFAAALRNETLITRESILDMCSLSPADADDGRGYGRGCDVRADSQGSRFGHTGSTAGIQARFFMYWERGIDVVVLSNHDEQAAPVFREIDAMMQGATGRAGTQN